MALAFTLIVGLGCIAAIVGLVGFGIGAAATRAPESETERKLASHRRRMLLTMLQTRSNPTR